MELKMAVTLGMKMADMTVARKVDEKVAMSDDL
jgi:hypothetical protein